jgi:hypothetical protein
MAWINLTDNNGSNIFMNMDHVLWFSVSGEDGHAGLVTMIGDKEVTRSIHVQQSPAEVVALLRAARQEVAG